MSILAAVMFTCFEPENPIGVNVKTAAQLFAYCAIMHQYFYKILLDTFNKGLRSTLKKFERI